MIILVIIQAARAQQLCCCYQGIELNQLLVVLCQLIQLCDLGFCMRFLCFFFSWLL